VRWRYIDASYDEEQLVTLSRLVLRAESVFGSWLALDWPRAKRCRSVDAIAYFAASHRIVRPQRLNSWIH
jgi:hypothetical protein